MQPFVDFIVEVDKLKGVTRKIRPIGLDRYENPAEHSWHIALLAMSLVEYAAEPVDIHRVIRMLLVHDIGEIDIGDTSAFAQTDWKEIKSAELRAAERIFSKLPEPHRSHFLELWREFEEGTTPESRFANAADRAIPVLLNLSNNGQSWRENGITHERVVKRVRGQIEAGCPALWQYIEERLREANRNGWFSGA